MSILPNGVYTDPETPWWTLYNFGTPANLQVSTVTVNSLPAGNILLTHNISSGTEYNAPLIFQRPPADINAPSESLVMNTSLGVPTKPIDGEYITATKAAGTVYDDIAVAGLQIYGNQTTAGNAGAVAYITGNSGNLILAPQDSVYVSSLFVSTLTATNVISTTATTGTSLTLTSFLSSASVTTGIISTNSISTSQIVSKDIFASTLTVSTLNAPNFTPAQVSTIVVDTKLTLTSTLTLLGVSSVNLGLGDVIQGLIGGAASQGLGAVLGGAALATGAAALITARTSGGVNNNVFQTVNGSTQLQFSTIGASVSSVFLTVDSPDPFTTPGLEISTTQGVAAGTYCVRSVGDPLYINNNVSSIQMYGQWVPVIQPTATVSALAISSLGVSSINGAVYPPPGGSGITSTIAISTATINGNFTQSGTGTFNWGGNTMSGTQVVLNRATSINNTLTTSGGAFLNAGATVNNGLTVASGPTNLNTGLTVGGGVTQMTNSLTVFGQVAAQAGLVVNGGNAQFNGPTIATNTFSANGLATFNGGARANNISTINISTANIDVSTVNGAPYPPPGGGGIPSTLNASTITFNGGLTNIGSAPIITNALSSFTVSTASLFVSSVNGVVYPPPSGTPVLPSTIALSTVTVNGGQTINNGGFAVLGGFTSLASGASVSGGLTVASGNTNIVGGLSVTGGNTQMTNALTVFGQTFAQSGIQVNGGVAQFNSPVTATNTLSVSGLTTLNGGARASFISTINISTTNINLTTVNGATYPPPAGIPSTLNASTLTVNGGQTITNGSLIVSGGISIVNGGMTVGSGNLLVQDPTQLGNTLLVNGLATLNGGINTPALSTNTISTASIFANALSTNTISSASISVSSINGTAFPQPIAGIPSTLNASTINVNGGINIANGGIINNSFEPIRTGFLSTNFISTGLIRADTVQAPIFNTNTLSTNVIRAGAVSTIFLSSQTITASNIGCFQVSSLTGSIFTLLVDGGSAGRQGLVFMDALSAGTNPAGNTKAVGNGITTFIDPVTTSYNIQNGYTLGLNKIVTFFGQNSGSLAGSAQFFSTLTVCADPVTSPNEVSIQTYPPTAPAPVGSVITKAVSTQSIQVSSINGAAYPPPTPALVPTGSITIWAGGNDNGAGTQTFNVPSGWLLCDGSILSQVTYAALYAVIGQKYLQGYPPGPLSFYLPDLTFAVPMGTPVRNYAQTFNNAEPFVGIGFQSWTSTYITNPAIQACWKINSTYRGTLNYGTIFPVGTVEGLGIAVYVSQILQYDGYQGYIIVTSADGVSSIPNFGSAFKQAQGQGTIEQVGGDFIYTIGSFNVLGRPLVTHNQTPLEVATHQHAMGSGGNNGPPNSFVVFAGSLANSVLPEQAPGGPPFGQSTISSITTGPPGFPTTTNIGTYTAPNFINMLYIIKT